MLAGLVTSHVPGIALIHCVRHQPWKTESLFILSNLPVKFIKKIFLPHVLNAGRFMK